MADVKISALPVATVVSATDVGPIVHAGLTVKATATQLTTAALNATPVTVAQGGSAATTFTAGYLKADGVNPFTTVTTIPWSDVASAPYIEVADTTNTINLTATPVLLKPTTIVGTHPGIDYDPATGEFTFNVAGNYGLSVAVNALASNANQSVYWYAENNTGAGWVVNTNSGKSFGLVNNNRAQVFAANYSRRAVGQKVRYWIYSNNNNVNLAPTTLGATGAIVPAIRIQYSG